MAERILHIDEVKSKQGFSENCNDSTITIILISLAIEYARQHVVYGMMETEPSLAPFFKTYFRMREIEDNDVHESHKTFLAIDLESCNYRYAFLKKEEEKYRKEKYDDKIPSIKSERMLVILPSLQQVTSSGEDRQRSISNSPYRVKNDDICHFPTAERNPGTKKVIVRLSRNQGALVRHSKNTEASFEEGNVHVKSDNSLDPKHIFWNMLRSFPKQTSKKQIDDHQKKLSIGAEMQRLQVELAKVENTVLPSLWSLYKNVHEERVNFEHQADKRLQVISTQKQYNRILERRREEQEAWELQQQQDDNAVCDICYDGESTGENRIIFCDSCNISVHQNCYGIEKVPSEDYFCHACTYFKSDKPQKEEYLVQSDRRRKEAASTKTSSLPIVCEMCPRRQGAFIRTLMKKSTEVKWVHVVCAKWQGVGYVDENTGELVPSGNIVEDVTELKNFFRLNDYQCCLCEGMRGCFVNCSVEGCNKNMHVTCARSSGLCNVNHGTNHLGAVESEKAWSLFCPDHSAFDDDHVPAGTAHLRALAKTFPLEPKPPPPPKPFYKMTRKERDHHLADPEFEKEFIQNLIKTTSSSRCEICNIPAHHNDHFSPNSNEIPYMKCHICNSTVHTQCLPQKWKVERSRNNAPRITCTRCLYVQEEQLSEEFWTPECHMCNSNHGTLLKAVAIPLSMKKWKTNHSGYRKSYFGRQIWCHPICGM